MTFHSLCLLWELCGHRFHTDAGADTNRHLLQFLATFLLLLNNSGRRTGGKDRITWVHDFLYSFFLFGGLASESSQLLVYYHHLERGKNGAVRMDGYFGDYLCSTPTIITSISTVQTTHLFLQVAELVGPLGLTVRLLAAATAPTLIAAAAVRRLRRRTLHLLHLWEHGLLHQGSRWLLRHLGETELKHLLRVQVHTQQQLKIKPVYRMIGNPWPHFQTLVYITFPIAFQCSVCGTIGSEE